MDGTAIVGVDDMARRAAAGPEIARVVVRAQRIERRIKQSRLLQPDEHWVGAIQRPQATVAQALPRPAGLFQSFGDTDFRQKPAAPFKDPQHIPG